MDVKVAMNHDDDINVLGYIKIIIHGSSNI